MKRLTWLSHGLFILLCTLMLTACAGETSLPISSSPAVTTQPTPEITPTAVQVQEVAKEDDSIRAMGIHSTGRLLVKPINKASVTTLGAPSCYGLETDYRWSGEYEAVWESGSRGTSNPIMTFPVDFEIIQQDHAVVNMQQFILGETDIFAYVPRYTDCHGLETYFFGVERAEGKAFPISIEMKSEQRWTNISQLPHRPFQVVKGELILTGGYGAGQDFIEVYHFQYDAKKHALVLHNTDRLRRSDLEYVH